VRLPVALVGAGTRAAGIHAPLLAGPLAHRFRLVGVVGRSEGRAAALAKRFGVPWSLDIDAIRAWGAGGAVLCASAHENGRLGLALASMGLPLLLETPLALDLAEARALAAATVGLPVEVAEQNPRFGEVLLWRRIVEAGWLGRVRAVASDAAGYRYHAAAVARALLGRPPGRHAVGLRTLFDDDFGRGQGPAPLVAGALVTDGGALYQVRDGEPLHTGAWQRGGWWVAGERGSLGAAGFRDRDGAVRPIVRDVAPGRPARWRCGELHVDAPIPGDDEDAAAAARCLLDWRGRIDGVPSDSSWSARDGLEDLAWAVAIERAATLGARVAVPPLLGEPAPGVSPAAAGSR
jgi:predicted dehydrogenase